jgi:hypothetical protein
LIVDEFGFDAAIDYTAENLRRALRDHCPKGIDVYYDNVGGDILDAALTRLARGARVVICGAVSQFNAAEPVRGPANYLALLPARAAMKGMVVFDYADRYAEAATQMAGWIASGLLISREDAVSTGIRAFPHALIRSLRRESPAEAARRGKQSGGTPRRRRDARA